MNLLESQPESRKSTPVAWGLLDALGMVICVAIICLSLALPGSANWPLFGLAIIVLAIWAGLAPQQGVDDSAFPCRMEIDYVRMYQKK